MKKIEEIKNHLEDYVAEGIGQIQIDDEVYTEYDKYTSFWEQSMTKSPDRTQTGAMPNLNTISTFESFHVTVHYDIMPIDDFRRLMKQFKGKQTIGVDKKIEVTFKGYDHIYNQVVTRRMYLATPQMPDYYELPLGDGRVAVAGVHNYTLEFIDTNNAV